MARKNKSIEQLFHKIQILVDNIEANDAIKAVLATRGITAERVTAFKEQFNVGKVQYETQISNYSGKKGFSLQFREKLNQTRETYSDDVEIARIALEDSPEFLELLDLYGSRDVTLAGGFAQMGRFYQNALDNADVKTKLAAFGLTEVQLQAGLTNLNAAITANSKIHDAAGDAEQSTQKRNAVVAALGKERSRILKIAGVALKDQPELLEKLK